MNSKKTKLSTILSYLAVIPLIILGVVSILATGGGSSSSGGFVDPRPWAEEPFSFDVVPTSQTSFRLDAISGTITVTGTPGATSISITGERRVQANTLAEATTELAKLKVIVDDSSPTEVVVETVQPQISGGRNYIVNYTITLPPDLDVNIVNIGDTTVRALKADCTITGVAGRIQADAIEGNTSLTLITGDITAQVTVPPAGQIDMGVITGSIDLQIPQTTSAQFDATVGIGSITVTNLVLTNETITPGSHTGTLGGGSGTISLNAGNGTIAVRGF
jgi:hypothetical protein